MYEALALLAAGMLLGLGVEVARGLLALTRYALEALVHAIRWHAYRPLVRRYYLARHGDSIRAAMLRHPAGKGNADAHNHALS